MFTVAKDGHFCTVEIHRDESNFWLWSLQYWYLACEVVASHKEYQNSIHMQFYNWLILV